MRKASPPGKSVTQVPPAHRGSPENHSAHRSPPESHPVRRGSPNDRRSRAAQSFILRAFTLVTLIGGVAYLAWFSQWARPIHSLTVESAPPTTTEETAQSTTR